MGLRETLLANFKIGPWVGPDDSILQWTMTALGEPEDELLFRSLLMRKPINICVEIGTFQGVATALLAEYSNRVYTVDIVDHSLARQLWQVLCLDRKVENRIIANNEEKRAWLDSLPLFDLAFIDGNHSEEETFLDFELVKRCGRVIFHDADFPSVQAAIKRIEAQDGPVEICVPPPPNHQTGEDSRIPAFGYWERGS